MKPILPPHQAPILPGCVLAVALSLGLVARTIAADTTSFLLEPNAAVPDGNPSGLVSVLDVPDGIGSILDVDLSLTISGVSYGGWNGDLFVLLSHGGTASILVNRPGLTAANPFGYGDNGLHDVLFDDEAASGDFHIYQTLSGAPGDSEFPISGAWQPDARATDPDLVLDTDLRSRFLSSFDGVDGSGEWRLFIADLSRGGSFELVNWELRLASDPLGRVPEPATGIILAAATVLVAAGIRVWPTRRRGHGA